MPKSAKEKLLLDRIKAEGLIKSDHSDPESVIIRSGHGGRQVWLFDLRALMTQSDDLNLLAEVFWDKMEDQWPFQVGGLEVGAIPLVAAIVMKGREKDLKVNSFVVRKSRKKKGLCKQIEGSLTDDPIVVVDDLINSGQSMRRVLAAVSEEHKTVHTIFTYLDFENESAKILMEEEQINYVGIFKLSEFDVAITKNKPPMYPEKNTLKPDWVFKVPMPNYVFSIPHSGPVFDAQHVYYGADNGYFYAVNKRSGDKVWEFKTGESLKGIFSTPVLTEHGVIFGAYDGSVYHLDREDGTVIWEAPVAEFIGSSPVLAPELNLVFIGLEHSIFNNQGALVALNLETGEKVWEQFTEHYMHSSPAYWAEEQLVTVGSNDGKVFLFEARNGRKIWEFAMEGPLKAAPTFDIKRRQIIAPSFDKNCYGIDIDTGQENFRFSAGHVFYNTALVVEDRLYVGSCDKSFYIYDLEAKKLLKKLTTAGRILSHPQLINGDVWFGSNDGGVRQMDLEGNYLGGTILPERPVTPVVYDPEIERYFVVTMGNYLVSLKSRED